MSDMQVQEFGQWMVGEIAKGERDQQVLTARYIEYVAACVARQERISELRSAMYRASAELDQLEAGAERGTHYHLHVDTGEATLTADQFNRMEQIMHR